MPEHIKGFNPETEIYKCFGGTTQGTRDCVVCDDIIHPGEPSLDVTSHIGGVTRSGNHCTGCASKAEEVKEMK